MHMQPASDDVRLSLHPFLARLRDPALEAAYRRASHPCQRHAVCMLALYCLASAAFGFALLPPGLWPFGMLFGLALGGALLAVARAPAGSRWHAASCPATLLLGMSGFLLCFSRHTSGAAWHDMAFGALLMAPYANTTNRVLLPAAIGILSSAIWLGLQAQPHNATIATLVALNLGGLCASCCRQRLQRLQFLQQKQLAEQATRDHLTGCYNRRYLDEQLLGSELADARCQDQHLTAIMCDIDHFKRINDRDGHAAGDQVLRTFAGLLTAATRHGVDSVVRHGGEEFLLLLPGTDLAGGVQLAERLRASLAPQLPATASFGVASARLAKAAGGAGMRLQPSALIEAADQQLYHAKRAGRDCVKGIMLTP